MDNHWLAKNAPFHHGKDLFVQADQEFASLATKSWKDISVHWGYYPR